MAYVGSNRPYERSNTPGYYCMQDRGFGNSVPSPGDMWSNNLHYSHGHVLCLLHAAGFKYHYATTMLATSCSRIATETVCPLRTDGRRRASNVYLYVRCTKRELCTGKAEATVCKSWWSYEYTSVAKNESVNRHTLDILLLRKKIYRINELLMKEQK